MPFRHLQKSVRRRSKRAGASCSQIEQLEERVVLAAEMRLPGEAAGVFGLQNVVSAAPTGPDSVVTADLDGDGDRDILSASYQAGEVDWYENDGFQVYSAHRIDALTGHGIYAVAAADLDGDGDVDVLIAPDQSEISWYENDGDQHFTRHTISTNSLGGNNVIPVDFDGDGDLDVVSSSFDTGDVSWFENDGAENFTTHLISATGGSAESAAVADIDGDGDLDVVASTYFDSKIEWFENDGDQNFAVHQIDKATTNFTNFFKSVVTADVDGDGDTDIAAVSFRDNKIIWYENDGHEVFTSHLIPNTGDGPVSLSIGDLDGDGDQDFLAAASRNHQIAWYKNDGQQNFREFIISTTTLQPTSVLATDLNGEGDLDILAASGGDNQIVWFENMLADFGDAPVPYPTTIDEDGARHRAAGPTLGFSRNVELDGVHSPNAEGEGGTTDESLFYNSIRIGALRQSIIVNVENAPAGAKLDAWIDFDGDGTWGGPGEQIANSVAVVNGENTILFDVPSTAKSVTTYARLRVSTAGNLGPKGFANDGEVEDHPITLTRPAASLGEFSEPHTISDVAAGADSVTGADLDGDGDLDVLSASSLDDTIAWYENNGSENFNRHVISSTSDGAAFVATADVDGDGDLDVLTASTNDDTLAWYENDGHEAFTQRIIDFRASGASSIAAADMDGDGDLDILATAPDINAVLWYQNDGQQNFVQYSAASIPTGPDSVFPADVDRDGDLDILTSASLQNGTFWFENKGDAILTSHTIFAASGLSSRLFAADLDEDGDLDVVSASFFDDQIAWYENDGQQHFVTHIISTDADGASSVFVADLDGDGDFDVLSSSMNDNTINVYRNDGTQNFTPITVTTNAIGAKAIFVADVDGDGDLDVLSASSTDNKIAWYENLDLGSNINSVSLTVSTQAGTEAGTTVVTVTATTTKPVTGNVTVPFAVSGANITATDYSLSANAIAIADGQTTGSVTFTIADDQLIEGTETATITLVNPPSGLELGTVSAQSITITDNDLPVITSSPTAVVAENFPATDVVLDVNVAPTPSSEHPLTYSFAPGMDALAFVIDPATGEIRFKNAPDYELPRDDNNDNVYHLTVIVSADEGSNATQDVTITVTPVNDNSPVFFTQSARSVDENFGTDFVLLTIQAIDGDQPRQTVTYTLSGPDSALFNFSTLANDLRFNAPPDYEMPLDQDHDNVYHLTITASDGARSTSQDLTITVLPVNDNAPVITSGSTATVVENTSTNNVVLNVNATDVDLPAQSLVYNLAGADAALFAIDPVSGEIRFLASPSFGNPADQGGDNVYQLRVTVTDSGSPVLSRSQDLTITVVPTNAATPVFDDASPVFVILENSPAGTVVGGVSATDTDVPVQSLSYSIIDGNASGAFAVDSLTGQITVADPSALDFETTPTSTLTIRVTDSGLPARTADAIVVINLTNVVEAPQIIIPEPTGTYHLGRTTAFISPTGRFSYSEISNPDYSNAVLTVSVASGRNKHDVLSINPKGSGTGQIDIKGNRVLFSGQEIGTVSGGKGKRADLVVTFNNQATTQAVDNLLRRLNFYAKSEPGTPRTISMQVTHINNDADSNTAIREIAVVGTSRRG